MHMNQKSKSDDARTPVNCGILEENTKMYIYVTWKYRWEFFNTLFAKVRNQCL